MDTRLLLSFDLSKHPISFYSFNEKKQYIEKLSQILSLVDNSNYIKQKLSQYKKELCKRNINRNLNNRFRSHYIEACKRRSKKIYIKIYLALDLYLILWKEELIEKAIKIYVSSMSVFERDRIYKVLDILDNRAINYKCPYIISIIQKNKEFINKPVRKILFVALISAGKSTLINALVGKNVVPTSQEICTGNETFIYEKPTYDKKVNMLNKGLELGTSDISLKKINWNEKIEIYTPFNKLFKSESRLCIIDTPGINSALNTSHKGITEKIIKRNDFDFLVYIISRPGSDEETTFLKWISLNADKEKIIFVFNKLDQYNIEEDNISESLYLLKKDLNKLGFENPKVLSLSAYFALLLKKSQSSLLSKYESIEYINLKLKFSLPEYDLSKYYEEDINKYNLIEQQDLLEKTGITNFERIIYGGSNEESFY